MASLVKAPQIPQNKLVGCLALEATLPQAQQRILSVIQAQLEELRRCLGVVVVLLVVVTYLGAQTNNPVDGIMRSHRILIPQLDCLALDNQEHKTTSLRAAPRLPSDSFLPQTSLQSSQRHHRVKRPIYSEAEPVLELASLLAI